MAEEKSGLDRAIENMVSLTKIFGIGYDPLRHANTTSMPADITKAQRAVRAFMTAATYPPDEMAGTPQKAGAPELVLKRKMQVKSSNALRM